MYYFLFKQNDIKAYKHFYTSKNKNKYQINAKNYKNIFGSSFMFENKISKSEMKLKCKNNRDTKKWVREC